MGDDVRRRKTRDTDEGDVHGVSTSVERDRSITTGINHVQIRRLEPERAQVEDIVARSTVSLEFADGKVGVGGDRLEHQSIGEVVRCRIERQRRTGGEVAHLDAHIMGEIVGQRAGQHALEARHVEVGEVDNIVSRRAPIERQIVSGGVGIGELDRLGVDHVVVAQVKVTLGIEVDFTEVGQRQIDRVCAERRRGVERQHAETRTADTIEAEVAGLVVAEGHRRIELQATDRDVEMNVISEGEVADAGQRGVEVDIGRCLPLDGHVLEVDNVAAHERIAAGGVDIGSVSNQSINAVAAVEMSIAGEQAIVTKGQDVVARAERHGQTSRRSPTIKIDVVNASPGGDAHRRTVDTINVNVLHIGRSTAIAGIDRGGAAVAVQINRDVINTSPGRHGDSTIGADIVNEDIIITGAGIDIHRAAVIVHVDGEGIVATLACYGQIVRRAVIGVELGIVVTLSAREGQVVVEIDGVIESQVLGQGAGIDAGQCIGVAEIEIQRSGTVDRNRGDEARIVELQRVIAGDMEGQTGDDVVAGMGVIQLGIAGMVQVDNERKRVRRSNRRGHVDPKRCAGADAGRVVDVDRGDRRLHVEEGELSTDAALQRNRVEGIHAARVEHQRDNTKELIVGDRDFLDAGAIQRNAGKPRRLDRQGKRVMAAAANRRVAALVGATVHTAQEAVIDGAVERVVRVGKTVQRFRGHRGELEARRARVQEVVGPLLRCRNGRRIVGHAAHRRMGRIDQIGVENDIAIRVDMSAADAVREKLLREIAGCLNLVLQGRLVGRGAVLTIGARDHVENELADRGRIARARGKLTGPIGHAIRVSVAVKQVLIDRIDEGFDVGVGRQVRVRQEGIFRLRFGLHRERSRGFGNRVAAIQLADPVVGAVRLASATEIPDVKGFDLLKGGGDSHEMLSPWGGIK